MSVIDINLWIKLQVLKTAQSQLNTLVTKQFLQFKQQMVHMQTNLFSKLQAELKNKDEIIYKLSNICNEQKQLIQNYKNSKHYEDVNKYKQKYQKQIAQISRKYQQAIQLNKQYQTEFVTLINQLSTIKQYVQQLKQKKVQVCQASGGQVISPAKLLQIQQQDQIIHKINSLTKLQAARSLRLLDTIRQVTQISVHSDQDNQYEQYNNTENIQYSQPSKIQIQKQIQNETLNKIKSKALIQSRSFQCNNQIQDINTFFYNSSQLSLHKSQDQSFQYSLGVLKNYCSTSDVTLSQENKNIQFIISDTYQLKMPILQLKHFVNDKHLVFQGGYIYTGNTAKNKQGIYSPNGFGQIFYNHQLFYCGHWKYGEPDGWGKMYLRNQLSIRTYNGKWQLGVPNGPGTIKFWNNCKFMGTFKKGNVQGEGVLFIESGQRIEGCWENNRLMKKQAQH